jgi:hypothetical protein
MRSVMLYSLFLALAFPLDSALAADDKEIKAERRAAQQQRQQLKNDRARENREAMKDLRLFASDLKKEYTERARDLDSEYSIQREELKAERQKKIAAVDAELQSKFTGMLLDPSSGETSMEQLREDMKTYSDKAFEIKQQAAREEHEEFIRNEKRKHELFSERDNRVLDEAKSLGLMDKAEPIIAKPIGGELTRNEERWNEREKKEVQRLFDSNQRQLAEFLYGKELREWEIANKREDFELKSEKEQALHELKSEQTWLNSLMFSPQMDEKARKEFTDELAELNKKTQEINIEFNKRKKQNNLRRSNERRKIMRR